jgi:hypothetical protein
VCVWHISSGILVFGLTHPKPLNFVCGVMVAAWGVAMIFLQMKVSTVVYMHYFSYLSRVSSRNIYILFLILLVS